MPKVKTHRATAKRFSFTASGKVKRIKAYRRHLLNHKTSKRKMKLRKPSYADDTNVKTIKKLLPYV